MVSPELVSHGVPGIVAIIKYGVPGIVPELSGPELSESRSSAFDDARLETFINSAASEEQIETFRRHERSDRPLGDERFLERLEKELAASSSDKRRARKWMM